MQKAFVAGFFMGGFCAGLEGEAVRCSPTWVVCRLPHPNPFPQGEGAEQSLRTLRPINESNPHPRGEGAERWVSKPSPRQFARPPT